jgi:hypothetical protein
MKSLFRKLLLLWVLHIGVQNGVPMRPEEIRELLDQMTQPKIAHTLSDKSEKDKNKQRKCL